MVRVTGFLKILKHSSTRQTEFHSPGLALALSLTQGTTGRRLSPRLSVRLLAFDGFAFPAPGHGYNLDKLEVRSQK